MERTLGARIRTVSSLMPIVLCLESSTLGHLGGLFGQGDLSRYNLLRITLQSAHCNSSRTPLHGAMTSIVRTTTTRATRLAVRTGDAASWLLQNTARPSTRFAPPTKAQSQARMFTSSAPRLARGGPIKVAPDFTWRRPFRGTPAAQNVTLVTTDFDADAVLETLTSKCVSVPPRVRSTAASNHSRAKTM